MQEKVSAKPQEAQGQDENIWLTRAQLAFSQSTTFVDNNYRKHWENNLRHFQSKHHLGSKYLKASYKYRSKIFRPKTRSAIRNNEAAAVAAFFANRDVVSIEPQDPNDPYQKASADIMQQLLTYRLEKTIPWFVTCLGGLQDAQVIGVVASYQAWDYEERNGEILRDQPQIKLIPAENIRIAPGADWTDPINSSPYVIRMIPMYILDVKAKMRQSDAKTGKPKWHQLDDGEIQSALSARFDSTRLTREVGREDKYDQDSVKTLSDYDIVWVHQNFMRVQNNDFVYYTLGTEFMLTDPKPLSELYFHGERPIVMGCAIIESHKLFPSGVGQLGENVQKEINEVANQRLDNVKLVLNKRWFVRRGAQVDLKSIVRNVAGGVTLMSDITKDVKSEEFHDVTRSSYQEQDRLNVDYDELIGAFSASTIQSNRKLNETVGGMQMLRGTVNSLVEYLLRVFSETWVEPVMKQLVKLEQKYETDEVVLAIAARRAQLFQRYGLDEVTDNLLNQELTTTVNVGMGATDPVMKIQSFMLGVSTIVEVLQKAPPGVFNIMEIAKEVFCRLGYKDGARFFMEQMQQAGEEQKDPEKMQMAQIIEEGKQMLAQLQAQVKEKQTEQEVKLMLGQMKEEGQDRRKAAEIGADITMKRLDLLNPVAGEKAWA